VRWVPTPPPPPGGNRGATGAVVSTTRSPELRWC